MANKTGHECIYCEDKSFKSKGDWLYHFLLTSHNVKAAASIQQWPINAKKNSIVISGIEQIDRTMLLDYISYSVESLENMVFFEPKAKICLIGISDPAEFKRFLNDSHTIGQSKLRLKAYCDLRLIEWDAYFESADSNVKSQSQTEDIRRAGKTETLKRTPGDHTDRHKNISYNKASPSSKQINESSTVSKPQPARNEINHLSSSRISLDSNRESDSRKYRSNEASGRYNTALEPESSQSGNTDMLRYKQRLKDPESDSYRRHRSNDSSRSQSRHEDSTVTESQESRNSENSLSTQRYKESETSKPDSARDRSRETSDYRHMDYNDYKFQSEYRNGKYSSTGQPETFPDAPYSKNAASNSSLHRQDENASLTHPGTEPHKSIHESYRSSQSGLSYSRLPADDNRTADSYRSSQSNREMPQFRTNDDVNRRPEPYGNQRSESELLYSRRQDETVYSLKRDDSHYKSPWEDTTSAKSILSNTDRRIEDIRDPESISEQDLTYTRRQNKDVPVPEPYRNERDLPYTRRQNKDVPAPEPYSNANNEQDLPYTRRPNKDIYNPESNNSLASEYSRYASQREDVPTLESNNINNQYSYSRRPIEDVQTHSSYKHRNELPDSRSFENAPTYKKVTNDDNTTTLYRPRSNFENNVPVSDSYQNVHGNAMSSRRQHEDAADHYYSKSIKSETPLIDWEVDHSHAFNRNDLGDTARFKRQRFDEPVPNSYNLASHNALYSRRNLQSDNPNPIQPTTQSNKEETREQSGDDSVDSQQDSESDSEFQTYHHDQQNSENMSEHFTSNKSLYWQTNQSSSNIPGTFQSVSSSSKPLPVDTGNEFHSDIWQGEMESLFKRVVMPGADWTARKRVTQDLKDVFTAVFPNCEIVPCGPDFLGYNVSKDLFIVYLDYNGLTNVSNVGESVILETKESIKRIEYLVVSVLEHNQQVTQVAAALYGPNAITFKHTDTKISCKLLLKPFMAAQTSRLCKQLYLMDKRAIILIIMVTYWAMEQDEVSALRLQNPYVLYWLVFFYLMDKKILPPVIELQNACNFKISDQTMNVAFSYDENQFVDVGSLLASRSRNVREDIKLLVDWFAYMDDILGSNEGKGANRRHSLVCPRYGLLIDKRMFKVVTETFAHRRKKFKKKQRSTRVHWTNNLAEVGFDEECWPKLKDLRLPQTLSVQHPLYISENISLGFDSPYSQRFFHAIKVTREKLTWILLGTTPNVSLLNALSQKM